MLSKIFQEYNIPIEVLRYIDDKGVVTSERMQHLIIQNEEMINPMAAVL